MACCTEIIDLPCVLSCARPYTLGNLVADVSGDWEFRIEYAGGFAIVYDTFEANEPLVIDAMLNEDYTHLIQIFKPDGTAFGTCYSLTVKPQI